MAEIKREKKDYGVYLKCLPFTVGKFTLMEIASTISKPKANGRCEIEIIFSGTPGLNAMRPAEVLVYVEALRAVTAEARKTANKLQGTKSGAKRSEKRAPKAKKRPSAK